MRDDMKEKDQRETGNHPVRYSSRKEWIDSLDHDYLGACPDEINGYDARDPECRACRHIERWDEKQKMD
jgi:hypothetical protein